MGKNQIKDSSKVVEPLYPIYTYWGGEGEGGECGHVSHVAISIFKKEVKRKFVDTSVVTLQLTNRNINFVNNTYMFENELLPVFKKMMNCFPILFFF